MNHVVLIGNLSKSPELRYTGTGKAVTTMTVAVSRGFGKDEADFLPVVVWEKSAENCANYLEKGSKVGVQGSMQTRSYEDKDGKKVYVTEVVARNVEFLSSKREQKQQREPDEILDKKLDEELDLEDFEKMEDDGDLPF